MRADSYGHEGAELQENSDSVHPCEQEPSQQEPSSPVSPSLSSGESDSKQGRPSVEPPSKALDWWAIRPLRQRIQQHRIRSDVQASRAFRMFDDPGTDQDAAADGGVCCKEWYGVVAWWRLYNQRVKAPCNPHQHPSAAW